MKEKICDSWCENCVYCHKQSGYRKACDYILATGKVRPCPAGTGCTVKKKRKTKKKP